MCGIAAIFDLHGRREIDPGLLRRMTRTMRHRGPDGEGYHLEPGVGLGHRRLSIIDLQGGKQPVFNEDESVSVTYNGEIYNFQSLQAELSARGHVFRSRCDTEVIVHAWEEWGEQCVEHFNGMFAFAVYDRNKQRVFVARDRIGIKPLYYCRTADDYFLLASELKAIAKHPSMIRQLRHDAVEDFFAYGYVPEPKTIFSGINKLAPGHTMSVGKGQAYPKQVKYWDVPFGTNKYSGSVLDAADELNERVSQAVNRRMIADVPLGAFLSGGMDSSAIVASMAELSEEAVVTCSISFGDPKFNESKYANEVATQYRTNHHCKQVESKDYDLLYKLSDVYDEPFADSSALPTYRVCELARKHVTVALSGDGGDENLAGYRRYQWFASEEKFRRLIPDSIRSNLFGFLAAIYPSADWAPRIFRAKATLQAISYGSVEGYFRSLSMIDDSLRSSLFTVDFSRKLDGYRAISVFNDHAKEFSGDDNLSLVQYLDFKTYLPGDILTKVDRASMANSLEVRVPLLDHELVEWIATLPPDMKLRSGVGKYVFGQALREKLPSENLNRRKMGFAVPLCSWFRGPLKQIARRNILSDEMLNCGIFEQRTLTKILDQHMGGHRDYSVIIWALLIFSEFVRTDAAKS